MSVPEEDVNKSAADAQSTSAAPPAPDADSLVLTLPAEAVLPKDVALWAGVLVLLTLVVYWPSTNGALVWNDLRNVQAADAHTIWAGRWVDGGNAYPLNQYHPAAFSLDRMLYTVLGRDAHGMVIPFTFHLAALVLHCAAGLLLWLILRHLKLPGAWLAAAIFLLHPINAEAVAWISQLPAVLAGALCFGSIYCYLRFAEEDGVNLAAIPAVTLGCDAVGEPVAAVAAVAPTTDERWAWYAGAVALFVLAMLSKSTAWAMPVLTLAALWWRRRVRGRDVLLLSPMFLIAVILGIAAILYEQTVVGKAGFDPHWGLGDRAIVIGRTFWFYLGKILFPVRLSALYPHHEIDSASMVQYLPLAAAVLLAVILAAATRCGRGPIAALISFAACLLPASGVVFLITMRQSLEADHQAYIAVAPVIALVIGVLAVLLRQMVADSKARISAAVVLSALLVVCAGATAWVRAGIFGNEISFWQDTIAKAPNFAAAHDHLAQAYGAASEQAAAAGDTDSAKSDIDLGVQQSQIALRLDPRDAEAQSNWGRLLLKRGQRAAAIEHLRLATELNPKLFDAHQELGAQLVGEKQFEAGREELDKALAIQSGVAVTHEVLGEAFAGLADEPRVSDADRLADEQRAINEEKLAVGIDPTNIQARIDLANLLGRTGDTDGAILQMTAVAKQQHDNNEDDPATWNALGKLFGRRGRPGDMEVAANFFQVAVNHDPNGTTDAKKNLALAQGMLAQERHRAATRAATQAATAPATRP